MAALMHDVLKDQVSPDKANAVCMAGGNILRAVQMEYQHGAKGNGKAPAALQLGGGGS